MNENQTENKRETFEKYIYNKIITDSRINSIELEDCINYFLVERKESKLENKSVEVFGTFKIMCKLYVLVWHEGPFDEVWFRTPYFEEISD